MSTNPVSEKIAALAHCYANEEFEKGIAISEELLPHADDHPLIYEIRGMHLARAGRPEEGLQSLEKGFELTPENVSLLDALAHVNHQLKRKSEAIRYGEIALQRKDAMAMENGTVHPLAEGPLPEFTFDAADQHIIAFSLWGNSPRYHIPALENARLSHAFYPGWKLRYYCAKDVDPKLINQLRAEGAQIVLRDPPKNKYEGLFWRFFPVFDAQLKRVLVRDCDSVFTVKERVAVDEWLRSDKHFHIMRDHPLHSELVLAGMWGAVAGMLPPLEQLLSDFGISGAATSHADQLFLRRRLWPTLKQSA
ncbi:MAG: hypothetical protein AAF226_19335, partial [Verrucomicrobiota bacterium]